MTKSQCFRSRHRVALDIGAWDLVIHPGGFADVVIAAV